MVTNLNIIYSILKQFLGKSQLSHSYVCFYFTEENYFNFLLLCGRKIKIP